MGLPLFKTTTPCSPPAFLRRPDEGAPPGALSRIPPEAELLLPPNTGLRVEGLAPTAPRPPSIHPLLCRVGAPSPYCLICSSSKPHTPIYTNSIHQFATPPFLCSLFYPNDFKWCAIRLFFKVSDPPGGGRAGWIRSDPPGDRPLWVPPFPFEFGRRPQNILFFCKFTLLDHPRVAGPCPHRSQCGTPWGCRTVCRSSSSGSCPRGAHILPTELTNDRESLLPQSP